MAFTPPISVPPACGDCVTTIQAAQPEAPPQQFPSKVFRARDGKMRMDYGDTSVITDPAAKKSIVLDHAAKEVRVIPLQPPPPPDVPKPGGIEVPKPGAPPQAGPIKVEDLGKKLIDGQEAEGKRFTYRPPAPPPPPKPPEPPAVPGMPPAPALKPPEAKPPDVKPPDAPPPPDPELVSEVWTSTKLNLPLLTKVTGPFGEQTCKCKYTEAGEPAASLFQVPAGYKEVAPPPV